MENQTYKNAVLLDTNFILTAIKIKSDFFEQFMTLGLRVVIPEEVISELGKLKASKRNNERQQATVALGILKNRDFQKVKLGSRNVDNGILNFSRENPELNIATLDKALRAKIKNRKFTIRTRGKIQE